MTRQIRERRQNRPGWRKAKGFKKVIITRRAKKDNRLKYNVKKIKLPEWLRV